MNENANQRTQSVLTSEGTDRSDAEAADAPDTCVVCDSAIETTEWHPIATDRDADGELFLYVFCSPGCRATWDDT